MKKAILCLSYSTGACAIEYEILIAFTNDKCWHRDCEMRSKKEKRNEEEKCVFLTLRLDRFYSNMLCAPLKCASHRILL